MDLSDTGLLLSGFVISMLGLGVFMHGKKMQKLRNIAIGMAMMACPMLIHSLLWSWVVTGVCMAGVFFPRDGG